MTGPDAGGSDEHDDREKSDFTSSDTGGPEGRNGRTDEDRPNRQPTPSTSDQQPTPSSSNETERVTIEDDGVVRWFLESDEDAVVFVRDVASSVAIVAVIGLLLFAISGVWPPLVAVESGSMEPNMERGDLVFVVDEQRFVGDDPIDGTGVVTAANAQDDGHEKFGEPGDVVVFRPDGSEFETPVIHRAHFWVEEGENWVDRADEEYLDGASCHEVQTCPANHDGFVTKGDANSGYDQYQGGARTDVVKPEWVTGKASFRIPWLGYIRLLFDEMLAGILVPSTTIDGGSAAMGEELITASIGNGGNALATAGTISVAGSTGVATAGASIARRY